MASSVYYTFTQTKVLLCDVECHNHVTTLEISGHVHVFRILPVLKLVTSQKLKVARYITGIT